MFHKTDRQLNREQIKAHLKSAVMDLTPNVLDKIDLSVPQMAAEELHEDAGRAVSSITVMRKRMRVVAALAAACLCMVAVAGGTYTYRNGKVDSVIGIDVNPSVEPEEPGAGGSAAERRRESHYGRHESKGC